MCLMSRESRLLQARKQPSHLVKCAHFGLGQRIQSRVSEGVLSILRDVQNIEPAERESKEEIIASR